MATDRYGREIRVDDKIAVEAEVVTLTGSPNHVHIRCLYSPTRLLMPTSSCELLDRADDGPITDEWLLALDGWERFGGVIRCRFECGWLSVTFARGAMTADLWEWRDEPLPQIATRRQLLNLIRALKGE